MIQFTRQQIEEQYKKLPAELKEAAYSVDIANKIYQVGQKFALTIEQTGFLAEEAAYVILGLVRPEDFAGQLEGRLKADDEEAGQIAKEINNQIFLPLREALKRAHRMEVTELPEEQLELPPPAPVRPPEPFSPLHVISKEEAEKIKEEFKRRTFVQPVPEEKLPKTPPPPPPPRPIEPPSKTPAAAEKIMPAAPPPPAKPRIPPIDLRQGVKPRPMPPEVMRGAIFAPPSPEARIKNQELRTNEESRGKNQESRPTADEPVKEIKPAEQKAAPKPRGFDPYREPVE